MLELTPESPVVRNMLRKRDRLPGHEDIRLLQYFMGGGMRCAAGAGVAVGLCDAGMHHAPDVVAGSSGGAPDGAYQLNGPARVRLGASIFYEECLSGFIRASLPVADADYLDSVFRRGSKALDVEAVICSRPDFYVGVTRVSDGRYGFINFKTALPDPLTGMKASYAMKGLYGRSVWVNGIEYIDDSVDVFPLDLLIEQFQPTDILVIANQSRSGQRLTRVVDILSATLSVAQGQLTHAGRLLTRQGRYRQTLKTTEDRTVNVGILWSPPGLNLLSRNRDKLIAVMEASYGQTMALFGQPNAEPNLFRTP